MRLRRHRGGINVALKETVGTRHEASKFLRRPGDAVLVVRGQPRWLVLSCPCGCGEELPINLDERAGPTWRLYSDGDERISLFPSVWRDTGCGSHFIIWRGRILLFGLYDADLEGGGSSIDAERLGDAMLERLPAAGLVPFVQIADEIPAVPWDVLYALRRLVALGLAREGTGVERGSFGRK